MNGIGNGGGVLQSYYNRPRRRLFCGGQVKPVKPSRLVINLINSVDNIRGAQGALVRKVGKTVHTSVLQTYKKLIGDFPVRYYGGDENPESIIYPNGSRIWIGGLDDPTKVLSSERDFIQVCQAEEMGLNDWEVMTTRVTGRSAVVKHPQLFGDANPGPPRHWILTRAKAGNIRLIRSYHKDNPLLWDAINKKWTEQGKRSLSILRKLTGDRYARLFQGLWVSPEGVIYARYNPDKNSIAHFDPPHYWPRVVGIDPYGAYIGAVFGAYNPEDGVLHIYGESLQPFGVTTPEHVTHIRDLLKGQTIWRWFGGGPSENQARLDWSSYGIPLEEPANIGVFTGIDRVQQLLVATALMIHDNCPGLESEISSMKRRVVNGVITDTIENKDSFHLADALRYLVVGLTGGGADEQRTQVIYNPIRIGDY